MLYDETKKPRGLWVAALIFCVVVVADSWFRWATFQYTTFDIAFYTQSLWLALKGQWHSSLLDVSLMGNHQEPIAFLLVPFFKVWSHPMLLVLAQTLLLATMPFTGWRIARHLEFGPQACFWFGVTTLLAPATGFIALHEFHPEALSAPLLLLLLEARMKRNPGTFWLWFLLVLACKENMGLLLGWLCAVHFVLERERGREWQTQWNVIPGILAAVWFLICNLAIRPALNHGQVDYLELYSHLGGSGGEILMGFFTHPLAAIKAFWRGLAGGNLAMGLIAPFLFLPLFRPRWIIIAAPIFAQHLLSWRPSEWSIQYHYGAPLVPLMWFAAAEAGASLFWRDVVAGWMAVACAVCQLWFGPALRVFGTIAGAREAAWASAWKREMLKAIPADASVVAGIPYLSHLAKREKLHSLHHILKGLNTLSRTPYEPPPLTDVVIVDTGDVSTFDRAAGIFHPQMRTKTGLIVPSSDILLNDFLSRAQWNVASRNDLSVFSKTTAPRVELPGGTGTKIDEYQTFLGLESGTPRPGDTKAFRFAWDITQERTWILWGSMLLKSESGQYYVMGKWPIAPGVETGRSVEIWAMRTDPSIPPGKYKCILRTYDPFDSDRPPDKKRFAQRTFDAGEVELK